MVNGAQLREEIEKVLNEYCIQISISNPKTKGLVSKIQIRPVTLKGKLVFQKTTYAGTKAFHENYNKKEMADEFVRLMTEEFKQAQITAEQEIITILSNRKGECSIQQKKKENKELSVPKRKPADLSHNRTKRYILEEGIPVPFLIELGVMTKEGTVVKSKYDKFRQINRFLEFIEDILPELPKGRELTILDFGCGKSYLTFAVYYYLKVLKQYDIQIIGLDLKEDVIETCTKLSKKYGYDKLRFLQGDIASYEGVDRVDMVVTLHACDTATDYALAKAVRWGAKVILSVPCCQHELNKQIENELLAPVLSYGIIKERMAALLTDALRAQYLESVGYRTQLLEFIDMEHTPKNILIRGIFKGKAADNKERIQNITREFCLHPKLESLFEAKEQV